jgi:hypothetical protein
MITLSCICLRCVAVEPDVICFTCVFFNTLWSNYSCLKTRKNVCLIFVQFFISYKIQWNCTLTMSMIVNLTVVVTYRTLLIVSFCSINMLYVVLKRTCIQFLLGWVPVFVSVRKIDYISIRHIDVLVWKSAYVMNKQNINALIPG